MVLLGTMVNVATVMVGSSIGYFLHSKMPEKIVKIAFQAVGLFTLYIGFSMALRVHEILIMVVSLVSGAIMGEWLDIDGYVNRSCEWLKAKMHFKNQPTFTEGLVSAFLLFCMGSMTILGAFEDGYKGNSDLLVAKAIMDGISSVALASALGIGVAFSIIPMLIFQGGLTLLAMWFGKLIPDVVVDEMSAVGGLLIIGLGIGILDIKKLKVINMLPAIFIAVGLSWLVLIYNGKCA